ncbi:UDP-N-acetylmuramoyl-L-alanyl-D-glutamate--2,6-diaminopimelate ligase [Hydrogenophaga sp.]|uniref:UDP-N-acetylmuramoyl-L-alanyl-D-glutamate--2, 6-diaminopimelate ligase n=1 Tax=Hydrogenophaga sp. TaxID=1904254 RepID=UPI0019C7B5C9|nr:UDP-N-acetylmuramoyl-L-alanyl-D-glutamate--2,6-diaminopimelate ligase [Hydrogenophaga sp.]MBD3892648.1 UDP-N-acetylmuramoyl-L-alanyl-D-glutamate--2,6-diaminopimelate ligase [Hydrogenophaga sp.]
MLTLHQPQHVADWLRARGVIRLQSDSRHVQAGDGFVAWPGAASDARRFVAAALQAGASAALVERAGAEGFDFGPGDAVLAMPGLKAQAGAVASAFYGQPSAQLDLLAITGTNGKTSTAWWLAQLLGALGWPCALVGTLGIGQPPLAAQGSAGALQSSGLTTPDPVLLQSYLRHFVDQGLRACAIEASSIGLVEGRLNACRIKLAVFTNFTQDHLDYHGSMARYWAAKAMLFDWPGLDAAVLNLDDPQGVALAAALAPRGLDLWTVGIDDSALPASAQRPPARLFARELGASEHGQRLLIGERNAAGAPIDSQTLTLPLVGRYNVSNVLGVLGAARALGFGLSAALHACAALTPVPGRMEPVLPATPQQPLVLIDYAHTPDALEKALQALQALRRQRGGQLWVVLGCGGERDASKRPLMAAAAERGADRVVLTSDNPRSEDPLAILAQMQAGLSSPAPAQIEPDRARAIALAVRGAQACDVVLIAGKGHEEYQEVQGMKKPFSDRAQAQQALQERADAAREAA